MLSFILTKCSSYRAPLSVKRLVCRSTFLLRPATADFSATRRYLSVEADERNARRNDPKKIVDNTRMEERIHNAENWVTMKLSDKEASEFNKALGIEAEVLEALAEGERKGDRDNKKAQNALQKLKGVGERQFQEGRVKGFLEQNPFLCPGCGAPFQTRSPDTPGSLSIRYFLSIFMLFILCWPLLIRCFPGFLPKDIFHEHRRRSELTKQTQEAVKLLDMAGLDLDSPDAVEALRKGRVSEEVILGVQAFARKSRQEAEQANSRRQASEYNKDDANSAAAVIPQRPKTVYYDEITQAYETIHPQAGVVDLLQPMNSEELDAYRNRYAKFNKNKTKTAKELAKKAAQEAARAGNGEEALQGIASKDSITASTEGNSASSTGSVIDGTTSASTIGSKESTAHQTSLLDDNQVCICQRCFKLQNYGQVDSALRPGWSADELLTPERFEKLLGTIKDTPSVVLCLVDIFDLRGSILKNLRQIVGNNPVVIAANKVDLLPQDVSLVRLTSWIHSEVKQTCGFSSPPWRSDNNGDRNKADFDLDSYLDEQDSLYFGKGRKDSKFEYGKAGVAKPSKEEREATYLRRNNVHLVSCQTGNVFFVGHIVFLFFSFCVFSTFCTTCGVFIGGYPPYV